MADWEWDPTLYGGSAPYYLKGRLPYAPHLAQAFVDALDLDGTGRLIDVGTGPGLIAMDLAPLFEEVLGIDADADMVSEAATEGRRRGITNATWLNLRGEDLPAGLGSFRVATFAQSFHWMQRERVARALRHMLEPSRGRLVLVHGYTHQGVDPVDPPEHPTPPYDSIAELVERYLGSLRRAGRGVLRDGTPSDEEWELDQAGFSGPDVVTITDTRVITRTADEVVASVYSVSRSAPHLFGERLAAFESELRALLSESSSQGLFSVQAGRNELRIWRVREPG
jgi:ubiquinone/menaquinone biosynthesis C-methylase UbiE